MAFTQKQSDLILPATFTLIVGLGERGGRVAQGLTQSAPLKPQGTNIESPLGCMTLLCREAEDGLNSALSSAHITDLGRFLAGEIIVRLEKMLSHVHVDHAREFGLTRDGSTRALIILLADIREVAVRGVLKELLDCFEQLADQRLRPIFDLQHGSQNLALLPILTAPHITQSPAEQEIAVFFEALYKQVGNQAETRRAVASLYLLESVTDLSLLEEADLDASMENFCLFLIECGGSSVENRNASKAVCSEGVLIDAILRSRQSDQPLGTFTVSRAEMFTDNLWEYARCKGVLDVLNAIHNASLWVDGVKGRVEVFSFTKDVLQKNEPVEEIEKVTREVSEMAMPSISIPPWHNFKKEVDTQYGPDTGDATSDIDVTHHQNAGWLATAKRRIKESWQSLMDYRFDGIVEEFRNNIVTWENGNAGRPGLVERLQQEIDKTLLPKGGRATVSSIKAATRQTALIVDAIDDVLARAVHARDKCRIEDDPSLEPLDLAHADLTRTNRLVPSWLSMSIVFAFFCTVGTLLLGSVFYRFVGSLPFPSDSWQSLAFRNYPHITAGALCVLSAAGFGTYLFIKRFLRARTALRQLDQAAQNVVFGKHHSVQSYFMGRLRHVWNLTYVGALVRTREAIQKDLRRLRDIDRALVGAIERHRKRLSETGVKYNPDGTEDLSGLFAHLRKPLVWPLADEAFIKETIGPLSTDEIASIVEKIETDHQHYSKWRTKLPFLQDDCFDRAVDRLLKQKFASIYQKDLDTASLPQSFKERLAGFAQSFHRNIPMGLPYRRRESNDTDSFVVVADGILCESGAASWLEEQESLRQVPVGALVTPPTSRRLYGVRLRNGLNGRMLDWWPTDAPPKPNTEVVP